MVYPPRFPFLVLSLSLSLFLRLLRYARTQEACWEASRNWVLSSWPVILCSHSSLKIHCQTGQEAGRKAFREASWEADRSFWAALLFIAVIHCFTFQLYLWPRIFLVLWVRAYRNKSVKKNNNNKHARSLARTHARKKLAEKLAGTE